MVLSGELLLTPDCSPDQRESIPQTLATPSVVLHPGTFGTPVARLTNQDCDISKHFGAQSLIFDITVGRSCEVGISEVEMSSSVASGQEKQMSCQRLDVTPWRMAFRAILHTSENQQTMIAHT